MTTYSGKDGVVDVAGNTVAEVMSFSTDLSIALMEDSELSDAWTTYHNDGTDASGRKSGGGTVECMYDDTDTTGQDLLYEGAVVTLNLYTIGNTSGREYLSGSAIIESVNWSVGEETVKKSFNFRWNGTVTRSNVV